MGTASETREETGLDIIDPTLLDARSLEACRLGPTKRYPSFEPRAQNPGR